MTLKLATLYIILGSISFIACIFTFIVLIKKFLDRPILHCFFSYSDTIASSLLSLALLLDGIIGLVPAIVQQSCYHFKLLNGLFVVAIVTGFFSVLGISIERFHMFAVVRDYTTIRRKFSIFWFLSSWTLSIVFVIILLPQIQDSEPVSHRHHFITRGLPSDSELKYVAASIIFPGPHVVPGKNLNLTTYDQGKEINLEEMADCIDGDNITQTQYYITRTAVARDQRLNSKNMKLNLNLTAKQDLSKKTCHSKSVDPDEIVTNEKIDRKNKTCVVEEKFFQYYFLLLFLICFLTPVLITISLNFFISLAVRNTVHETISHHQWLSLSACVLMWGPSLIQLLLEKTFVQVQIQELSVFLFLLGHMHNLLRSVLHVLFVHHDLRPRGINKVAPRVATVSGGHLIL